MNTIEIVDIYRINYGAVASVITVAFGIIVSQYYIFNCNNCIL